VPSDATEGGRTNIKKRSIIIYGHKTSVSLEQEYWDALVQIARQRKLTISKVVGSIDEGRPQANLSSAIRLFILAEAIAGHLTPQSMQHVAQGATPDIPRARKKRLPFAKRLQGRSGK